MLDDVQRLVDVRRERYFGHCRSSLITCATELLAPRVLLPHHVLILKELERVVLGETTRLLLVAPPACGKTTLTSYILPVWAMAIRPSIEIIACSHTQDFADGVSLSVRGYIEDHADLLGYRLISDARGRWFTNNGSKYVSAGVRAGSRSANWARVATGLAAWGRWSATFHQQVAAASALAIHAQDTAADYSMSNAN